MASALLLEFQESRHYECFSLIIEFLISIKKLANIDIYVPKFKKDIFLVDWIEFNIANFKDIVKIRLIRELKPGGYQAVFYVTSDEIIANMHKLAKIQTNDTYSIVHHVRDKCSVDNENGVKLYALSRFFHFDPIPINFKLRINKEEYINNSFTSEEICHFFSGIEYFTTGNTAEMNLVRLNSLMQKLGKKCLVLSRRAIAGHTNISCYVNAPTKILIYCLLFLKGLFYPNDKSIYHNGQISGLFHLSASFGTLLFVPSSIYRLQSLERFKNIRPFLNDNELCQKLLIA